MDIFIDRLAQNQKLNDYQRNFLEYVKDKDDKMKQYVVQKFASFLKEDIPNDLISTEYELCEIKTQKIIDEFLKIVKDDNQIKIYLNKRKYFQMSLMEKLVIYVVLNDMINDDNIFIHNTIPRKKEEIKKNFKELVSKCKFKSHKGFLD